MVPFRLGSVHGSTLHNRRTASLLLTGLLVFGIGTTGPRYMPNLSGAAGAFVTAAKPVVEDWAESVPDTVSNTAAEVQEMASSALAPTPESMTRIVELGQGRTLSRMLLDAAIPSDQATAAAAALQKVYDHRKLRSGQEFTLNITRFGEQYTLTALTFEASVTKEITISRAEDGTYTAQAKDMPIERRRMAVQGVIRGSLYGAGDAAGVPRAIMASLIRAYAHEIDFQRDIRAGDKFEVLYDQPMAQNGTAVGQGVIIYAALIIGNKTHPLYRVTFGDGEVDYFNERGQSIKRSLLRTPLESARVTSGFGIRRHPILGYSKMHKGTDFGAPTGTPIYAAGSGTVQMAQWNGSYGRYIKLRHTGSTFTAYGHMSRFAKGIQPGARVKQGDVIGFVGSTGRSTGPHLHYEVIVNGQQVNPLKVSMPTGRVLTGKTLEQFKKGQASIRSEFSSLLEKKNKKEADNTQTPAQTEQKAEAVGNAPTPHTAPKVM